MAKYNRSSEFANKSPKGKGLTEKKANFWGSDVGMGFPEVHENLLRCKWSVCVLAALGQKICRPSQILRRFNELTPKVLWQRLKKLEQLGLVRRKAFDEYPKRTEYRLTREGKKLAIWAESLLKSGLTVDELTTLLKCRYIVSILMLLSTQPRRPKGLKARLKITDKMLFERLAKLESLGLINREILPTKPVQVIYCLTDKGFSILPLIESLEALMQLQKR